MKRKTLVFSIMLLMSTCTLFANDFEDLNKKVVVQFNKEFASARNVKWSATESFLKVSFTLNDEVFYAYYSQDGERIAITRNVPLKNLPMGLTAEIQEQYKSYWITDAFEVVSKENSNYFVVVENATQKITLKSYGLTSWETFKKVNKD